MVVHLRGAEEVSSSLVEVMEGTELHKEAVYGDIERFDRLWEIIRHLFSSSMLPII